MKKPIPFLELSTLHQEILDELQEKFVEVVSAGIFSEGKEVILLENNVRSTLNICHAIPCSNGTDALELALKTLDIGPGDEVMLPALTWISTAEAVVNVGASPVFCDVDMDGLLDLPRVGQSINPKLKAVIPVHLYGKMVQMPKLVDLGRYYGFRIVEDGAQAFGAFQGGRSAGSFGDIGCFSFYPTKNLGALGEAGLLSTKDPVLSKKIRLLLNHGQSGRDIHEVAGRNSKIDTLQAAFLNIKLRHFNQWQQKRKRLAAVYLEQLQETKELMLPRGVLADDHNAHLFTIKLEERDALKAYLGRQGIGTAVHYPNILPKTAAFSEKGSYPMAERISRTTLSLPLHAHLTEEEVLWVSERIRRYFNS